MEAELARIRSQHLELLRMAAEDKNYRADRIKQMIESAMETEMLDVWFCQLELESLTCHRAKPLRHPTLKPTNSTTATASRSTTTLGLPCTRSTSTSLKLRSFTWREYQLSLRSTYGHGSRWESYFEERGTRPFTKNQKDKLGVDHLKYMIRQGIPVMISLLRSMTMV